MSSGCIRITFLLINKKLRRIFLIWFIKVEALELLVVIIVETFVVMGLPLTKKETWTGYQNTL